MKRFDHAIVELFKKADAAGRTAATTVVPTPMTVVRHANVLDDASPVAQRWVVPDGVCGFAWVTIRPGTSAAARYAKAALGARKGYHGGMEIWVSDYSQSMTRKEAYARAFANVLTAAGVTAYAGSRMD